MDVGIDCQSAQSIYLSERCAFEKSEWMFLLTRGGRMNPLSFRPESAAADEVEETELVGETRGLLRSLR